MKLAAVTAAALSALTLVAPSATAAGDDYPLRTAKIDSPDGWGFSARECVSFAAWRLNQRHLPFKNVGFVGPNGRTAYWGNATNWDAAARTVGYAIGLKPQVGAVAQWHAHEKSSWRWTSGSYVYTSTMTAGGYGHVAVVTGVLPGNQMSLEQYNGGSAPYAYSRMSRATAPRYLYIAVSAPTASLPTAISDRVSSTSIHRGSTIAVTAHLYRPWDHLAVGARGVRLYTRAHGTSTWKWTASATVGSTGYVTFHSTPSRSTDYLVKFVGYGALRTSHSVVRVVGVS